MFTGFATENTPAIQVWDCSTSVANSTAVRSVALTDDCAPIQFFKTGSSTTSITLYLPPAPIEGQLLTIINSRFGASNQSVGIYSSDRRSVGTLGPIFNLGPGGTKTFFYSKEFITFGSAAGIIVTGWVSIDSAPITSANFGAVISGGSSNIATNTYSAAVGGNSCSATGSGAGILGGSGNTASGQFSTIVGSSGSTASQFGSAVVGGDTNTASNSQAAVIGGQNNTANSINSVVIGGRRGTTRSIIGNFVASASDTPIAVSAGVQQLSTLLLGRQTTDATATRLTSDINSGNTTNQVILPNNSAYTFVGTCIANVTGGGDTSGWKFEGVIKRGATAASTALVAAVTPTVIAQDAGASTWVLAITADTTNGGIAVTVTGQAATTIRWVVKIETTEVTF